MPVSSLKCFHEKTDTTREYSNSAIFVRDENGRRRILSAQSINTERASLTLWWVWYLQYLLLKDVLYNVKDLFWLLVIAVLLKRISSSTRYRTGVENFQQNRCTLLHLSFVLHVSKFLRVSLAFLDRIPTTEGLNIVCSCDTRSNRRCAANMDDQATRVCVFLLFRNSVTWQHSDGCYVYHVITQTVYYSNLPKFGLTVLWPMEQSAKLNCPVAH